MILKKSGKSPDYRFTLANERTFLAWIRTSLAFMAAAVGLDQLAPELTPIILREILVMGLSIVSAGLSWYAYRRWAENENAMRHDNPLTYPKMIIWLSGGLSVTTLIATLLTVYYGR
ncbi:hypothetical protein BTJ39_12535 [Izhakiella australiensis]|uniref:DUF202 domain-containing protein n=1 Tax=Izhakiella australiensis TaxID=1926881 RepID=A0A1S8YKD3_9GAMM|nr:DUF202 domain-containing protein [Izhakiella australiensis]OON39480.1 hypothetical protein BTJ39_12535 [Izhakiella australiensis]